MGQVFTIPAHVPFLPALAQGLLARGRELASVTVLLPTRRAERALVEALLAHSTTDALLLPTIRPLGDVDDAFDALPAAAEAQAGAAALTLPPAIAPMHRRLALAHLIAQHAHKTGLGPHVPAQAIALADELAALLDSFAAQDVDLAGLAGVVDDSFASHWQETLAFLEVITDAWPAMLGRLGLTDPARRRADLIKATCARWRAHPPGPIVAAGSTGSLKATADMLATIADMDAGQVVLPGLDTTMDDAAWDALEPAHPQFGLRHLLARMGCRRQTVRLWPHAGTRSTVPRTRLVSEALRPADTTDRWRDAGAALAPDLEDALDGLALVAADTPQLESLSIALALRAALETPGKTAALVTPDRNLARRVASDLGRWGIAIDDSGGQPLAHTGTGSFLLLVAQMLAEQFAPVPLLAALKHPLAAGGMAAGRFHHAAGVIDKRVIRGPRPKPGLAGLAAAVAAAEARAHGALSAQEQGTAQAFIARLTQLLAAAEQAMAHPKLDLTALVTAHISAAEALAATDTIPGADRLWADTSGDAAAAFMTDLLHHAALLGPVAGAEYPAILGALMAHHVVRPVRRAHPRLQILGPLEARLQHVDRLVLGGLNEGVWPQRVETGAWINRPMRAQLGLEAPERLIGLAAHDVAQGLGTRDVILTRSQRADGQPTVPSRWWLRLENLLGGLGRHVPQGPWLAMARRYDRPVREAVQIARPAPTPPVAARPARLSVTRIDTLFRDPYAIYAGHVLNLQALDDLDADVGARERGNLIHRILERFTQETQEAAQEAMQAGTMPADAHARLMRIAEDAFADVGTRPAVRAIWYPRFCQAADWIIAWETERCARIAQTFAECTGELTLALPTRPFTLSGTADRIDLLTDGTLAILDYKTGTAPSIKQTAARFSVQLPLEAAMAERGAFATGPNPLPAAATSELAYVELKGGRTPGAQKPAIDPAQDVMRDARAVLDHTHRLLTLFDAADTPYPSRPRPQFLAHAGEYDHLARVKEWQTATDSE